ncbi:MAG: hypothetical protein WDZ26_06470 [Nitriliruptoraceae bacterium]
MNPPRSHDEDAVRLLVAGPFDVGKTTLLRTLSGDRAVTTERSVSAAGDPFVRRASRDAVADAAGSGSTTVAMEFTRITTDVGVAAVFGSPGQRRFSFMWDLLARGAQAWILLVDGTRPDTVSEAVEIHRAVSSGGRPGVVGVNRARATPTLLERVRGELGLDGDVEVMDVDVRDLTQALALVGRAIRRARPVVDGAGSRVSDADRPHG